MFGFGFAWFVCRTGCVAEVNRPNASIVRLGVSLHSKSYATDIPKAMICVVLSGETTNNLLTCY